MRILTLGVEYMAPPIFDHSDATMGHLDPTELGLPANLASAILAGDDEFQHTLNHQYPPDSESFDQGRLEDHNRQGAELAVQLQQALGSGFAVQFVPLL